MNNSQNTKRRIKINGVSATVNVPDSLFQKPNTKLTQKEVDSFALGFYSGMVVTTAIIFIILKIGGKI